LGHADWEEEIKTALLGDPDNPRLLAALGGLQLQGGDVEQALLLLERAMLLAPDEPKILCDYGAALTTAGRLDEAESVLRSGVMVLPDDNLRFNLARCLQLQGKVDAALVVLASMEHRSDDAFKLEGDLRKSRGDVAGAMAAYIEALKRNPRSAAYLNDLGVLIETSGNPALHVTLWQQLAALPDAHAVVFYFLGNALRAAESFVEARAAFERAVALEPTMAEAHNNLALVLGKLGLDDEARLALDRATAANPDLAAPRSNLGAIMSRGSSLDEAAAMLREAVRLDPESLDARTNYGAVLMRQRRFAEAEVEFRRVLAVSPGFPSAELNLGLMFLTEGRLEEGWPYYDCRWKQPQLAEKRPPLASPCWAGEPLDGKTLLIYAEQGFGDNIQFVRYVRLIRQRYPTVRIIHYCLHSLSELFQASPVAADCEILRWGEPIPAHDVNCPIMSLPWRFGTTLASIPEHGPYLAPSDAAIAFWQARFAALPQPRVGLVWASSETFVYRSAKTVALRQLMPLLDVPGVTWVSLQFGKEAGEIAENDLTARIVDPMADVRTFLDTAAIVAQLDLVISVDTAVAHLAGAMSKPVWMLDRFDTDWRWLLGRDDSPWYPSLRIFRQAELGAWESVVERASKELETFVSGGQLNRGAGRG
jgi:Flp pilus assembly protein TadD